MCMTNGVTGSTCPDHFSSCAVNGALFESFVLCCRCLKAVAPRVHSKSVVIPCDNNRQWRQCIGDNDMPCSKAVPDAWSAKARLPNASYVIKRTKLSFFISVYLDHIKHNKRMWIK